MIQTFSTDAIRLEVSKQLDSKRRHELGQYLTPLPVARYMASLFAPNTNPIIRLLDAGAGIGTLTSVFLERWFVKELDAPSIELTAYEIEPLLRSHLEQVLSSFQKRAKLQGLNLQISIESYDFIEDAVDRIQFFNSQNFTHAILNPPYKKIHSQSQHRKSLSTIGIETVNLYSAFVALAVNLMAKGGEIVAIIPRSFCNGPYYRPFRELILRNTSIEHIHLFTARDKAFQDDEVLQENVIIHLVKGKLQETVTISTSTDETFVDYAIQEFAFEEIVQPNDTEQFIHIPTTHHQFIDEQYIPAKKTTRAHYSLEELDVQVSTGPVVDFRLKDYLRGLPENNAVPLLYPSHFVDFKVNWPNLKNKKPNAVMISNETLKWLFPKGFYTVVRRFSSKEEQRRIVANVIDPNQLDFAYLGFENHLNVFHRNKQGLPEDLAHGLAIYLNSSVIDLAFRRFSGHTQVNATDLRLLKYPSLDTLLLWGEWAKSQVILTYSAIDDFVTKNIS